MVISKHKHRQYHTLAVLWMGLHHRTPLRLCTEWQMFRVGAILGKLKQFTGYLAPHEPGVEAGTWDTEEAKSIHRRICRDKGLKMVPCSQS